MVTKFQFGGLVTKFRFGVCDNSLPTIATAIFGGHFLADPAVSGSASAEEGCRGTYAYQETL